MDWTNAQSNENDPDYRGKIKKNGVLEKFPYYFPIGFKGYSLNVIDQYDNGNDSWLRMDGNPNEWCVLYHGQGAVEYGGKNAGEIKKEIVEKKK